MICSNQKGGSKFTLEQAENIGDNLTIGSCAGSAPDYFLLRRLPTKAAWAFWAVGSYLVAGAIRCTQKERARLFLTRSFPWGNSWSG